MGILDKIRKKLNTNNTNNWWKESEIADVLNAMSPKEEKELESYAVKQLLRSLQEKNNGDKDAMIADLLWKLDDNIPNKRDKLTPQFDYYQAEAKTKEKAFINSGDTNIENKNEILEKYQATQKLVTELFTELNSIPKQPSKHIIDIWDRDKLRSISVSHIFELLKIWDKESWLVDSGEEINNALKSEFRRYYLLYYFFIQAVDTNEDIHEFKKSFTKRIKDYNIDLTTLDNCFDSDIINLYEKIRKAETTKEFLDKLYTNFVHDFRSNVEKKVQQNDKTWFFENLFNIAYHAVDYVAYTQNNYFIDYYPNLMLLQKNFDFNKVRTLEYIKNHADKSTPYTNRINEWLNELGVKDLKILFDQYKLTP